MNLVALAAIVVGLVLYWSYRRKQRVHRTEGLPQPQKLELGLRDLDTRSVVTGVVGLLIVVGLALITSGVVRR